MVINLYINTSTIQFLHKVSQIFHSLFCHWLLQLIALLFVWLVTLDIKHFTIFSVVFRLKTHDGYW